MPNGFENPFIQGLFGQVQQEGQLQNQQLLDFSREQLPSSQADLALKKIQEKTAQHNLFQSKEVATNLENIRDVHARDALAGKFPQMEIFFNTDNQGLEEIFKNSPAPTDIVAGFRNFQNATEQLRISQGNLAVNQDQLAEMKTQNEFVRGRAPKEDRFKMMEFALKAQGLNATQRAETIEQYTAAGKEVGVIYKAHVTAIDKALGGDEGELAARYATYQRWQFHMEANGMQFESMDELIDAIADQEAEEGNKVDKGEIENALTNPVFNDLFSVFGPQYLNQYGLMAQIGNSELNISGLLEFADKGGDIKSIFGSNQTLKQNIDTQEQDVEEAIKAINEAIGGGKPKAGDEDFIGPTQQGFSLFQSGEAFDPNKSFEENFLRKGPSINPEIGAAFKKFFSNLTAEGRTPEYFRTHEKFKTDLRKLLGGPVEDSARFKNRQFKTDANKTSQLLNPTDVPVIPSFGGLDLAIGDSQALDLHLQKKDLPISSIQERKIFLFKLNKTKGIPKQRQAELEAKFRNNGKLSTFEATELAEIYGWRRSKRGSRAPTDVFKQIISGLTGKVAIK